MSFTAALDISTFIWCKEDYHNNSEHYLRLISIIPKVFEKIHNFNVPILMRNELFEIIAFDFPYPYLNEIGLSYYSTKILRLLTTSEWSNYEEQFESNFTSNPNLVKDCFKIELKEEYTNQIGHLFNNSFKHKFITCQYFFNNNENLCITDSNDVVEIDTLSYSSDEDIIKYFDKIKIKFKHNPKHNKYNSGGKVSPLSCYNERTGDETAAQNLLENSQMIGSDYFWYDEPNEVYVQFVSSNDGTFHGYDISDEQSNVPYQIKNIFNKDGRKF